MEQFKNIMGENMKRYVLIFLLMASGWVGAQDYQVGDHELLLMPTAYTMPRHTSYFTDYELLFLNYSYGITSRTHIGAFTLFPITTSFYETFSVGIKQNYYRGSHFQTAVFGSVTLKGPVFFLGNVFSFNVNNFRFHLAPSAYSDGEEGSLIAMVGMEYRPGRKFALMLEYTNLSALWEEEFAGLISIGFRFIGKEISFEVGGIRPLEPTENFLFFPLLKATKHFK